MQMKVVIGLIVAIATMALAVNKDIYKADLANRFPAYSQHEVIKGDLRKFVLKNGEDIVMESPYKLDMGEAVFYVREQMVGGLEVEPMLTAAQIKALSNVIVGTRVVNTCSNKFSVCTNTSSNGWN